MSKRKIAEAFQDEQPVQRIHRDIVIPIQKTDIRKIPTNISEKEKYEFDYNQRPDSSNYETVPVEMFGAALLKGMGWKEGKPVGKNPNGLLAPIELKPRPPLLGIGADPLADPIVETTKQKQIVERDPTPPPPRRDLKGQTVRVTEGKHKNKEGTVLDTSTKKDGTSVKIKLKDETIRVWDDQIKIIQKQWIRPHIRVRILSKKNYNQKGIIQDVVSLNTCIVKLEGGNLVDFEQCDLETVIPRVGKRVLVVKGEEKGQVAELKEYNSKSERVVVQIEATFDLVTLTFDDVSEYVDVL
ncbi:hypothetical protein HK103_007410 [Boothiomyces macroporosus]|uniref:G-patch domain-containing protein n=1 Tax=Boothiomyces macroporosus TaxID=261099 RepID=A0AAD5UPD7_9FUNG|nr:hypothetical protein HK103_007410 [Boothiomyces macroporosus]